jgi:hypothetical protein
MAFHEPNESHMSDLSSNAQRIINARALKVGEPYNYCHQASLRLMDDLLEEGIPAQMLRCKGLITDAMHADIRWLDLGAQSFWVHFIVEVEGHVIDLTRRQFFPVSDYPFVQSYEDCQTEWDSVAAKQ